MPDPFREQRFSAEDVRRILRRAAELADEDPATASVEKSLTREEIERAAGELGLPASAVLRASSRAGDDADAEEGGARDGSARSALVGAPTRIVFEAEVGGEPSETDKEDVVEDIRDVLGETGAIETVGKTMIWKLDPGYRGQGRDLSVRLRSRNGRTRIVAEERLMRPALGLFLGLGLGGGLGPMGGYIVAIIKLGVVGLVFPLVWIPLMLLLARTIFGAITGRRERSLRKLMRRLERNAASWSGQAEPAAARARVAAPRARVDAAPDAEEEAEAEAEAAPHAARRER